MRKSKGLKSRSRYKLKKSIRPSRANPISRKIQVFEDGNKVHIIIDSSIQKGQPHPRFHGKTGEIVGQKGKAYLVGIKDGNKPKELIIRPEHLKLQE
ncbi:MAG: 50S ribosomal protein L21e [Methanosphaera sp.]|uniref:50S ribosomal protein L21e n=1 Tax=Methanosphaera sp. TaxID=2666342 RepID=UPI0025DE410B|nr:50S ribosomal protein L21e [Methanosphaera sp.]MCI5866764.1 50S ribosomal protein L21e [Methanosphaera sp.]MDD6534278.1 50S ribosomal protein L21e [Methanosphaera sp.]MDY3956337.1 50S ribosomal protein L21e [Methanosphaera sp.]